MLRNCLECDEKAVINNKLCRVLKKIVSLSEVRIADYTIRSMFLSENKSSTITN